MVFFSDRKVFLSEGVHSWTAPIRVPINFFVLRGSIGKFLFKTHLFTKEIGEHRWMDDEEVMTHYLQKMYNTTNAMFMNTTVAHYSYDGQSRQLGDFWLSPYQLLTNSMGKI